MIFASIDVGEVTGWLAANWYQVILAGIAVWGWLSPRLPKEALDWLAKVGGKCHIDSLITQAAILSTLKTDAERRAWVVKQLTDAGVPTVIADMIVAWVYKQVKARK